MKLGMKEVLLGATLLVIGSFTTLIFLQEFLAVIKGIIGPLLLTLGFLIAWIGYEDLREGV